MSVLICEYCGKPARQTDGFPVCDPYCISEEETDLRAIWDAKGVSKERQEELLADLTAKAQPGATVGPFKIGEQTAICEMGARTVPSGPLVPKVGQNGSPMPLEMVEEDGKQGRLL